MKNGASTTVVSEDRHVRLNDARPGAGSVFGPIRVQSRPALERFSPQDAQWFVGAVNRRLGA